MKVVISGASGLVGGALARHLEANGHDVWRLVRRTPNRNEVYWNIDEQRVETTALTGADVVVHLAGEPIAGARWSTEKKRRIKDSRVLGTRLLVRELSGLSSPPRVLISASAIGYYGNGGDAELTESSPPGRNFLAEVCTAWEAETEEAAKAGIRVVNLRVGIVLAKNGGALKAMIPAFRLGLGGPLGDGQQWISWIALDDLVRAIVHCMDTESISGPVLGVSPNPVRQVDFARALGRAVRRPSFMPAPRMALKMMMGEMGQQLLLDGQRCVPQRLQDTGFKWHAVALQETLFQCVRA